VAELFPPNLAEQIACLEREIVLRRRLYPSWVRAHRLSQPKADREIACMEAALASLRRLEAGGGG
jgi:hypothetical protein